MATSKASRFSNPNPPCFICNRERTGHAIGGAIPNQEQKWSYDWQSFCSEHSMNMFGFAPMKIVCNPKLAKSNMAMRYKPDKRTGVTSISRPLYYILFPFI